MDCFTALPSDLHHAIFNLLSYYEKMNIIFCNSSLYRLYLKKERMIQLKDENTVKFFYDLNFQQRILEKIHSPLEQLIIHANDSLEAK